jgi:hypothetical protein
LCIHIRMKKVVCNVLTETTWASSKLSKTWGCTDWEHWTSISFGWEDSGWTDFVEWHVSAESTGISMLSYIHGIRS